MKQAKRIAFGTLAGLGAYLGFCALLALLLTRGTIAERGVDVWVLCFACAASYIGAMTAARGKRAVNAALCAAVFWTAMVLLGVLADELCAPRYAARLALPVALGGVLASASMRGGKRNARRAPGRRRRLQK